MKALLTAIVLALVTGCSAKKPVHIAHRPPTLQQRAAAFVEGAQDTVKLYIKDEKAARYEQAEIAKVQDDIDKFNLSVPDTQLWAEIDNLVADLEAMAGKDEEVYQCDIL